jgi:hypothetical protein
MSNYLFCTWFQIKYLIDPSSHGLDRLDCYVVVSWCKNFDVFNYTFYGRMHRIQEMRFLTAEHAFSNRHTKPYKTMTEKNSFQFWLSLVSENTQHELQTLKDMTKVSACMTLGLSYLIQQVFYATFN